MGGFGHVLFKVLSLVVVVPASLGGLGHLLLMGLPRGVCGEGCFRYPVINKESEDFRDLRWFPKGCDRGLQDVKDGVMCQGAI